MDKKTVLQMLQADFVRFHKESNEFSKAAQDMKQETFNYVEALIAQLSSSGSGHLLAKTPKVPRKRATRIKAIPEDEEIENDSSLSNTSNRRPSRLDSMVMETSDVRPARSKRGASVKAADIIKKQQSLTLHTKLRRPSNETSDPVMAVKEYKSKRPKESPVTSEDEDVRPVKQSKVDKKKSRSKKPKLDSTDEIIDDSQSEDNATVNLGKSKRISVKRKLEEDEDANTTLISEQSRRVSNDEPVAKKANLSKSSPKRSKTDAKYVSVLERISEKSGNSQKDKGSSERMTRSRSSSVIKAQSSQKYKPDNIINETMESNNPDETTVSMYEDAIGKPIPIMNSTMNNPNSTVTLEKMMNATVVIEPMSVKKFFNDTVTIKKSSFKEPLSRNNSTIKEQEEVNFDKNATITLKAKPSKNQADKKAKSQKDLKLQKFDELITDDESSPERKEYRVKKGKQNQTKRITRSSVASEDDEILPSTPKKTMQPLKDHKGSAAKSTYKQAALFSPYAKDSVKKRVEAFEQVAVSPKHADSETTGRVTRTKTRALAAASFTETAAPTPSVSQKLARKSLAKAKKISLAKHARENDDVKENEATNIPKLTKTGSSLEKSTSKSQLKTTPLGKNRMLQVPSSVNKNLYTTPSNQQTLNNYSKTMTGSRGNIVTHVDSFIQPMKSASKQIDKVAEEKRRRAHEEDARRKREELLKAQADEKRRKREEKELKNKLAREAKEKLEHEKRLKTEREREEKARLAQQQQEKQKEEMERKRYLQMQRAQEKEERRRQEEQLRLQRMQEQEEQERLLAEQRRREQELEKRKLAEQKHLAELKLRQQMEKAKAKALAQKQQGPASYKIDSDPDEEDSDDESKPKHDIPTWADKRVRPAHLAMQQHIPMKLVLRFFDAKKCTPDLRELFKGIDPKKLKRSSSAIWKTPPRFSMMNCSIIKD